MAGVVNLLNCPHSPIFYTTNQRWVSHVQTSLYSHVQLLSTKVAGEVILRQNNQHLTAAAHTVCHVLDDGSSKFKVPAVDAVVNRVLLKNCDEIFSDPTKVLWTIADKQSVYEIRFHEAICKQWHEK